jgi:DUF4097 and DUF4098 domain-containing protein YvlB
MSFSRLASQGPRPRKSPRYAAPLAILAALALAAPGRSDETERFEKGYELTGIDRVKVQNVNGPVHIETWDKPHLHVTAVKKAKGSRAEQVLRETEIRVTKRGGTIDIETILPKKGRFFGLFFWGGGERMADVSYEISLPAAVAVEVETVNGRVTAAGRAAPLSLNTVNGSVKVEAQDAPLKVNTVNGSVDVAFSGPMRKADVETVNGSVTVTCAKNSSIRYDLQTVNGRIQSEFAELNVQGKWGPKEARGSINAGREHLAIETVNGDVRLYASETLAIKKLP